MAKRQRKPPRTDETLTHNEASRKNIPTAEFRAGTMRPTIWP